MLTDTHAHLYWDSFKTDFDAVIQRSLGAGVTTIINVGVDVEKSQQALEQIVILGSETTPESNNRESSGRAALARMTFYSTVGIHPHEAWKYSDQGKVNSEKLQKDIDHLEKIYHQNPQKVVAVGECGLDFFFGNNPDFIPSTLSIDDQKNLQRELFISQINLAKKLNLPLIVHIRDDRSKNSQNIECWTEAISLTKDHFGIYHCYSGIGEITQRILNETRFLISFADTITYPKNEYLREAAKIIPLDRIVLETDCPFLPPQSKRGERNEPSSVREIAELIVELKGINFEEVANQTTLNIKKLIHK